MKKDLLMDKSSAFYCDFFCISENCFVSCNDLSKIAQFLVAGPICHAYLFHWFLSISAQYKLEQSAVNLCLKRAQTLFTAMEFNYQGERSNVPNFIRIIEPTKLVW